MRDHLCETLYIVHVYVPHVPHETCTRTCIHGRGLRLALQNRAAARNVPLTVNMSHVMYLVILHDR